MIHTFLFLMNNVMYWFVAVLGLWCCLGFSPVAVCELLLQGPSRCRAVSSLPSGAAARGSVAAIPVVHGPHCSAARGILPDRGSNVCLLPWQADSSPLSHQGSPEYFSKCLVATYISSLKKWLKSYASILPQTPLPSRLPHNSGQSSHAVQKVLVMVHFKFNSVYMSTQHSKD